MVNQYKSIKRRKWVSAAAHLLMKIADNAKSVEEAVFIIASKYLENVSTLPTDLDAICKKLNITEIISEDLPNSGELRKNGWGYKIVYSSFLSKTRKQFTIAHELGHAMFEMSGRNWPRDGKEVETLCNMFASQILMPREQFRNQAGNEIFLKKIFELAKIFETSIISTALRYYTLIPTTFVFAVDKKEVTLSGQNRFPNMIRKGSPISSLDESLREAISRTFSEQKLQENVYFRNRFWHGDWKMEGSILGRGHKALFLLYPLKGL